MIKNLLFPLLLVLLSMAQPSVVHAFTAQVRGGVEMMNDEGGGAAGIDFFLYEGRQMDAFIGLAYFSLHGEQPVVLNCATQICGNFNLGYDVSTSDLDFGIRFRPFVTSGRWKPYILLGGVGGRISYSLPDTQGLVSLIKLLTKPEDSALYMTYRAGAGMDIGVSERFSMGIEGTYTGPRPKFSAVVADLASGTITDITVNEDSTSAGVHLLIRYTF